MRVAWHSVVAFLMLALLSAATATFALADVAGDCNQRADAERQIRGCTALIEQGGLAGPQLARAYHNRGTAYRAKEEHDRAIDDYNRVRAIDPKWPGIEQDLRRVFDERMIVHLTILIERGFNREEISSAYNNRGVAYLEVKGRLDLAMADWTKSIEYNPRNKIPYNNRAWGYLRLGKPAQALEDANLAIELDPNYVHALEARASAQQALAGRGGVVVEPQRPAAPDALRSEPSRPPVATAPEAGAPATPRASGGAYLGCFRDQGNPWGREGHDLDSARWDDGGMTTARCISFCRGQNFTYAGTQYGTACFCGNAYGRSGRADNCDVRCAGNAEETCGGAWANSIWRVRANSSGGSRGSNAR